MKKSKKWERKQSFTLRSLRRKGRNGRVHSKPDNKQKNLEKSLRFTNGEKFQQQTINNKPQTINTKQ
jgi:hypothetical protein